MKGDPKNEIVSLNQSLFSLEAGNLSIEALDQRLELAIAIFDAFHCGQFVCGTFENCTWFSCTTFSEKPPEVDG